MQKTNSRSFPTWLKGISLLIGLAAIGAGLTLYFTHGLTDTAKEQLESLREGDYSRAYYEYTARQFKSSTSLDQFIQFVKANPALSRNADVAFTEKNIQDHVGTINGILTADNGSITPVSYQLIKERDRWKILSMKLSPSGALASSGPVVVETTELIGPVQEQLDALRNQDIPRAYFGYTTRDFRDITPLRNFRGFVQDYPVLTRHRYVDFNDGEIVGDEGILFATLQGENGSATVEYQLVREGNEWKIWSIRVDAPKGSGRALSNRENVENILSPVEAFLAYLRAQDPSRAYYETTAQQFQSATSADAFRNFVSSYPALQEHQGVSVEEPLVRGDSANVLARLQSPKGITQVEYQLVRAGPQWKIWNIQVQSRPDGANLPPTFDTAELVEVIEGQLKAIRTGDLSKAYYAFTSKEFQRSTPVREFERFTNHQPVLRDNAKTEFTQLSFKDGVGTFKGLVYGPKGEAKELEYDLVREGDQWRIQSVQVFSLAGGEPEQEIGDIEPENLIAEREEIPEEGMQDSHTLALSFDRVIIGTEVNKHGRVAVSRTALPADNEDFHVDLYCKDVCPGNRINLVLEHIESATRIPPVDTELDQEGDAVMSFTFTPPTKGWPRGNYRLTASSEGGEKLIHTFVAK